MSTPPRTPADLLRSALDQESGRPLVTFYDDATGERVELSVATFANWTAKTANLLQDELATEPGDRLALLLPAHWQTAVWLLACSSAGVVADMQGDPAGASLVVAGPESLEAARACGGERVALSLLPLGARFPERPEGFVDYAAEVPGQGDQFMPYVPVGPGDPFCVPPGGAPGGPAGRPAALTGGEAVDRALADAESLGLGPGSRVLSRRPYDSWDGLSAGLLAPLAVGGSVVLCRNSQHLDAAALGKRGEDERVTHTID
ncbi:acyl-CoA synthetase [Streptomyces abyssalis]|uniref:Acyl-CoA synthetase n=1 Tax=Streptomyces abyssalis TaxID=933944 RepID=A0A1E7JM90_9ACTN|nr:TIGR03089 family protein [Streptomyces abyssalis]OEU87126.1 acyl-CoA synthetase [Streptomyces abyssalis]OEU88984.1 acyl-CoA synthetase [Streptomyces abyssalis]OEV31692.1 acyl-CoA synthetase [Streptomyces nanshensis]